MATRKQTNNLRRLAKRSLARLAWLEPIWILLLALPILLPGRFSANESHAILIAGLFLFWPLRRLAYGRLSVRSPADWPLTALLLLLPIALWASAYLRLSWAVTGYFLLGFTLYFSLINWPPAQRKPEMAAWALLIFGGVLALTSPLLTAWKPQYRLFELPLYAWLSARPIVLDETIHANLLAGALVVVLPVYFSLAIQKQASPEDNIGLPWRGIAERIGFTLITLFMGGLIVLTQSRGGYLAAVTALTTVAVIRWPRTLYITSLFIASTVLVAQQMAVENLLEHLSADGTLGGWSGRMEIWTQSYTALQDFAASGIGMGTFTEILPRLYPLRVSIEDYPHAHNLYIQLGLDLGLPGLIAFLALLLIMFIMAGVVIRQFRRGWGRKPQTLKTTLQREALMIGAAGALAAMSVHGLLDVVLWGNKLSFVPWLLWSFITLQFLQTAHVRGEKEKRAYEP